MVIEGAGVHGADEFHDGNGEGSITGKEGGLYGGSAAIFGEKGGVNVQDAFWLEKV